MKQGRKFWMTLITAAVLVAILPVLKWVMGGAIPPDVVKAWLLAFVGNATQFGATNAVEHIAERGARIE